MADPRVPVTLLTGFLGAGKTTLLNAVLSDSSAGRVAVIVNEFGEAGLDHDLIEESSEEIILMRSGCLCCSVRGDLSKTIADLFERRVQNEVAFERIVIETTGLADPGPILQTLLVDDFLAKNTRMDGVVTVVDAAHAAATLDAQFEEDLAQLIYDLKQINPRAKVCVKLVAQSGIGTVAAGVAKAKADAILISGHNGGTGASPQTSIKYAGLPWELGLSEVHQVLSLNNLRDKVILRTDGGLKTGKDIVIAAMLGAEEYGIGTASLVAMGCIMVRQCHSNTCPVGVCSQDEKLREKFTGTPEKVINLFTYIAEEVREILAELGFKTLDEIVGRADLLHQVSRGSADLDDLDLNPIIQTIESSVGEYNNKKDNITKVSDSLDLKMIKDLEPLFTSRQKTQLSYNIKNTDRALGTRLASEITTKIGMNVLEEDQITINLNGSAGQSFGAFSVKGTTLKISGDANDYVGKGLSGGKLIIIPPEISSLKSNQNVIIGNTCLYGATKGTLYAAGKVGDRFAVRNSGAHAVIEGCGDNGCEYMTGGSVVILGEVGNNFGAGMTGGMAFAYDKEGTLPLRINLDDVFYQQQMTPHWEGVLYDKIQHYFKETNSQHAKEILDNWDRNKYLFWQIIPKEMVNKFEEPVLVETTKTA